MQLLMSRYVLVGMLVSGMVVDTALAGRLFRRSCCRSRCRPVCAEPLACAEPCRPLVCAAPVVVSAVEVCCVASGASCVPGALSAPGDYASGLPVHSAVPALADEPLEMDSTAGPIDVLRPAEIDPPAALGVPETAPLAAPPAKSPKKVLVPASSVSASSVFGPSVVAKPAVVEPVVESAKEDRLTEAVDIFDEPISPTSPTSPAPIVPTKPEAEAVPADDSKGEPKEDSEDDAEDLFGGLVEEEVEEAVVTEVLAPAPVEASLVSDESEAETDFADALFGPVKENVGRAEELRKEESKSVEPSLIEPTPEVPEEYDVFGAEARASVLENRILSNAGGLESDAVRGWTDRTATFRCEARLVDVSTQSVTLVKSTGEQVVVPLSRLGTSDLRFVQQQVVALRVARARDTAAEKLAVVKSAK